MPPPSAQADRLVPPRDPENDAETVALIWPARHGSNREPDLSEVVEALKQAKRGDVQALLDYAVIGILAALAFMLVFRPLAVLISIGPFLLFQGKNKIKSVSWQDMVFMMWVRETGAIPAVLLVVAAGMSIPGTEALVPVGMWVIILTLIVQPPLTPWVARKLNLVD